ncbi:hypothetical protein P3X46_033440 [Hevea brasiliensis]|uniref:starch synthase n=1 Tax=Hevea brasiliensis TaxID=3981 RepID=A0ABQ9KJB7_HEVBR|nr:hypothetical protein P3X46_033440 [Hevea brasiliensis]
MEVGLQFQVHRPLSCRAVFHERTLFKIKAFLGSFPHVKTSHFTSLTSCGNRYPKSGVSFDVIAGADFSKRRNRKISTAKSGGPTPKGFKPKTSARAGLQKRDSKNNTSASSEIVDPNKQTLEIKADIDKEQSIELTKDKKVKKEKLTEEASSISKKVSVAKSNQGMENGTVSSVEDMTGPVDEITIAERQFGSSKNDITVKGESAGTDEKSTEDSSQKLRLEMEENLRKREIEGLAEDNFSRGSKLFVYPELVKSYQDIELYLNRSLSTLNNEPDVFIMGAFNDRKWKSFTIRELEKVSREQVEREREAKEKRQREEEKAASEVDRAQAKVETEKRWESLLQLMKNAARSVDNVWHIEPSDFKDGGLVQLYYNKSSGPLSHSNDLWIHGGYNNWNDENLSNLRERMVIGVVVPDRTLVLDWVFADGPPQNFHAIVTKSIPEELFWVEEEHQIYRKLQEERPLREEAIRAKVERTARMKAERKERALKRFLLSQKQVVYIDPLDVQAGSAVTVFYNPANTVLNGKSEVWIRCSFNRWTHHNGPLPPQKMLPPDNASHIKSTVKLPLDAYMMDFVFSEREDGGIFYNRDGMDCHIPVFGGVVKEPPMRICMLLLKWPQLQRMFSTGCIYSCRNDGERFGFFCHAALEFLLQNGFHPVSPTYSKEVAGNLTVAPHLHKFHGILNGIDPDIWDPYNDKFIHVVLLGSAPDPRIQNDFVNLANQLHSSHNDRARLCLTYDEPLSHLLYAGADFILVPSIFEPCGLTQLTAMRYGSIPVVRKTGGLYDTVFDVDHDKERSQAQGLVKAISAWYDGRERFNLLCKTVMDQDWSWNKPALEYIELPCCMQVKRF